jgi:CheY-like chemotaxis protein
MTDVIRKPRVLVADDETVVADTLAMILKQSGFNAQAVYSGEAALVMAESFLPDAFVTDVVMTGIDGIETASRMLARLPNLRVLLFSGTAATAAMLESARRNGYNFDILQKPVHPTDLLAKLQN